MRYRIVVSQHDRSFECQAGQSVLSAMQQAGLRCLPVGCRSGGCGVCRVQVLAGEFECGTMSGAQVAGRDRENGVVLACQLYPRSDLELRSLGRPGAVAVDPSCSTEGFSRFVAACTGSPGVTP